MIQGHKDLAEQVLRDSKDGVKDNPAGYRMLGDFYLGQGEWDKAAAEFASLHSEHPKDAAVTKSYIEVLIQQNRLDDAENDHRAEIPRKSREDRTNDEETESPNVDLLAAARHDLRFYWGVIARCL